MDNGLLHVGFGNAVMIRRILAVVNFSVRFYGHICTCNRVSHIQEEGAAEDVHSYSGEPSGRYASDDDGRFRYQFGSP